MLSGTAGEPVPDSGHRPRHRRPDDLAVLPIGDVAGQTYEELYVEHAPGTGGAVKSSWYGDCLPTRDFPMLVDLHLGGRLPLDKFVSETIALDDVEKAFGKMGRGEVLRSVVVF